MTRTLTPWLASFLLHLIVAGAVLSTASHFTQPRRIDLFDFDVTQLPAAAKALETASAPAQPKVPAAKPIVQPKPVVKPVAKVKPAPKPLPAPEPAQPVVQEAPLPTPVEEAPAVAEQEVQPAEDVSAEQPESSAQAATRTAHLGTVEDSGSLLGESAARYVEANFAYIRDRVMAALTYPAVARRQGWSGQVRVEFVILTSGKIENLKVASSSGYPLLDRQALKAVRAAEPFPPPRMAATITLPVNFVLN